MLIFNKLLDFLIGRQCPFCGELNSEGDICLSCYSKLDFLGLSCIKCQQPMNIFSDEIKICTKCSLKDEFYNEMRSALSYNKFLKQIILRFKNNNETYLGDILTKLLYLRSRDLIIQNSIIVPVPLFKSKIMKRGYNQSSILAKKISKLAEIDYIDDLIIRIKDTETQAGKTAKERLYNVESAFILNNKYNIKGKTIFIIDDIITTGATIFECAKTVNIGSPEYVNLLSLGRRIIQ